ncbi:rhamnogalacturonase [Aureobasidium namibiae CBS 147.97]|uniref:rhamnogalacturonan endolyase n=1 Tax=Aureobasidium namibiae CBS 147.97 TaxID=1043004 RepID=A0A074WCG8_9PEZI|nr:rhamnogalacturonase [Aureobasidium namibiae CBS 147.97]KEQ70618.1 rhamnogalacturonase [Aureobasidium namibiae CBS 147.97]
MLVPRLLAVATALFSPLASAAFGLTSNGNSFVLDAGSSNSLVVTVGRKSCDITSILYRGEELQYKSTGSHISSGLGSATVSGEVVASQYAKITCKTATLTHYIVVKSGDSSVHMATHTTAEPTIGELRFVARLNSEALPLEYPFGAASTIAGSTSTVEGSDVYLVNGETRSKFYSSQRFIDDKVHCVYRDGSDPIHACMWWALPRDINSNNVGDYTGLYFYMNSGHVQTEPFRQGLHGPYTIAFTRSGIPAASQADTSFFSSLGVTGYVANSGRGRVSGTASGIGGSFQKVVHWHNTNNQYWTYADSSDKFTSPAMRPGTYTMAFVTVTAGTTASKNIASRASASNTIWTIGDWDGQPTGFRNADKQLRMHPSDKRMSSWGPLTYTVGTSKLTDVPMALWKGVNDPFTIKFTLSAAQTGAATLRVGTTLNFAGARPQAKINNYNAAAPAAPVKIDSRGVTRGAYRGNGEVYDVKIPAGTLVTGANTIVITVASGSSGATYLAPNIILDAIELFQ